MKRRRQVFWPKILHRYGPLFQEIAHESEAAIHNMLTWLVNFRNDGIWKFANPVTVIEQNFALSPYPGNAEILAGGTRPGPFLPATRDRSDLSYSNPVIPRRPVVD